ncbi:hypothetical protein ES707_08607 [subsurface metagenome]
MSRWAKQDIKTTMPKSWQLVGGSSAEKGPHRCTPLLTVEPSLMVSW